MKSTFNLIICITIMTSLTCVRPLIIQRSPYDLLRTDTSKLSDDSRIKERSIIVSNSQSDQGKDNSLQDRIARINTHKGRSQLVSVDTEDEKHRPKVLDSCKNSTYCEDAENYPIDAVEDFIPKLQKGFSLQIDKLDQVHYTQRTNLEDGSLCEAPEKVVYPKVGTDYNGKYHFLLNGNKKETRVQGFRVQSCEKVGCKCDNVILSFQNGYRGRCKQFYIYRTATALKKNDTGIYEYQTEIKLPGYCSCIAEPCKNVSDPSGSYISNIPRCD